MSFDLSAAKEPHVFSPGDAEPEIIGDERHNYSVVDPEKEKGKLLVFLPGTSAGPLGYLKFIDHAADLGYHSIGLNYYSKLIPQEPTADPDDSGWEFAYSVNQLCRINDPSDSDAHRKVRLEIIDGEDRVDYIDVNFTNSIENRLLTSLKYLHTSLPNQNWDQYFEDETILWSKITVAGHSQGGGHAALIAKTRLVDRCLMFSTLDWWYEGGRISDWVSDPMSATPIDSYFYLSHSKDELIGDFGATQQTNGMRMGVYGKTTNVQTKRWRDLVPSRILVANDNHNEDGSQGEISSLYYHNQVVVDGALSYQEDGVTPLLSKLWSYMLLYRQPDPVIKFQSGGLKVFFSHGQLERSENLIEWNALPNATSPYTVSREDLRPCEYFRLGSR